MFVVRTLNERPTFFFVRVKKAPEARMPKDQPRHPLHRLGCRSAEETAAMSALRTTQAVGAESRHVLRGPSSTSDALRCRCAHR